MQQISIKVLKLFHWEAGMIVENYQLHALETAAHRATADINLGTATNHPRALTFPLYVFFTEVRNVKLKLSKLALHAESDYDPTPGCEGPDANRDAKGDDDQNPRDCEGGAHSAGAGNGGPGYRLGRSRRRRSNR